MKKTGYVTKGISISKDLLRQVLEKAEREERSFSSVVRRALQKEISGETLIENDDTRSELMEIGEVAKMLKTTAQTVRRRAKKPGDPLYAARSRVGCQRPMHFRRSLLVAADQRLVA